ncbi:MAG: hypothetical protein ACKORM_04515, partial [Solirubrobacterales bacterium]
PSGKMPNPKVGTVTEDIEKAVGETKSGKVEYRTDRQAIVHMVIGKASFDPQRLLDNYAAVMDEITRAKPSAAKGRYVISASVSTTMGPGIPIDPTLTTEAEILGGAPVASNGSSSEAQADQPAAEVEEVEVEESEPVAEEVEVEEVEEPEPAAEEAEATDDGDEASASESEEVGDEDSGEGSDEDQEA